MLIMHDKNEGKPWAKVLKSGGGDLGGEDGVFDAEDGGTWNTEEDFVLGDILNGD
jgi:hypothetical protein